MIRLPARLLAPCLLSSIALLTSAGCGGTGDGTDVGTSESAVSSANNKAAFDFFVSKGLSDDQAAGIVGNLDQESGMNPSIEQYGGGPGRGIAQWSAGGRWDRDHDDNVVWYASAHHASRDALTLQLEFIWYELTTFGNYGLADLRAARSVSAATIAFEEDFEGCGQCDQSTRIAFANEALAAYGHHASGGGGRTAKGCYSDTKAREMPANACVQSKYDDQWYQCDDGAWVDRWTDPAACDGVYPL